MFFFSWYLFRKWRLLVFNFQSISMFIMTAYGFRDKNTIAAQWESVGLPHRIKKSTETMEDLEMMKFLKNEKLKLTTETTNFHTFFKSASIYARFTCSRNWEFQQTSRPIVHVEHTNSMQQHQNNDSFICFFFSRPFRSLKWNDWRNRRRKNTNNRMSNQ